MKRKELLLGLASGLIVGGLIGAISSCYLTRGEDFSISVLNQRTAIKINKRTGETWQFDDHVEQAHWQIITNSN
jgi:hypothetical protein